MAFGESKMKGAPNGHLMWRVGDGGWRVEKEAQWVWNGGHAMLRSCVKWRRNKENWSRSCVRRSNDNDDEPTRCRLTARRVRRCGDKGQREVAECQAYADGEMLALLKAIKWNYNLIVINNSEDSLSGVANSLRGCESLTLLSEIRATRKYPATCVCPPTHLIPPTPPPDPASGPPSPHVRLL